MPPPPNNHHISTLIILLLFTFPSLLLSQLQNPKLTRFQNYLRINTAHPTPNYSSAISYLTSFASTIPFLTHQTLYLSPNKPILLITYPGTNPSLKSILFNSHLDSVPAEPEKWLHNPFSAFLSPENGNIYARGAQDDKCISMQYLEALNDIINNNYNDSDSDSESDSDRDKDRDRFRPLRSVHLLYVPEEEVGGYDGMAKFVESEVFKELNVGFVMDEGQASVGEEFRVFYADRQPWHLVVKAVGEPGHGARLVDGGAMENMMKSVEVVMRFRDGQFDMVKAGLKGNSEVVSANPVFFKAGTVTPNGFVMNMQPSEVEAGFDVRLPPMEDPDVMRRRIAEEWAPSWRNMSYEITEKGYMRDFMGRPLVTATNNSNPWWTLFEKAIADAGGKLAKPEILASTTDARFMRRLGIPTLGFSPMKNTPILLHDHNEFLKDTVYLEGIEVYKHIIRSLSSYQENDLR